MTSYSKLGGLYLAVSPILPFKQVMSATEKALDGGVDILQLSIGRENEETPFLARMLAGLAKRHEVPFLVNNNLKLAAEVEADGVHFDDYAVSPAEARQVLGSKTFVGYTVNTDLEKIRWAEQLGADYVSFCSIFHKCPGGQCPIVPLDIVKAAVSNAKISVFAAGGITIENVFSVLDTGVDGVVVTSAILNSKDPMQTARNFKEIISRFQKKK